jgi:hypothetical protein
MMETSAPPICYLVGCGQTAEYAFITDGGMVFRTCRAHHPSSTNFLKPIPLEDADVYEVMIG